MRKNSGESWLLNLVLIAVIVGVGWVLLHLSGRDVNGLFTASEQKITPAAEKKIIAIIDALKDTEAAYRDQKIHDLGLCQSPAFKKAEQSIATLYGYFICKTAIDGTQFIVYSPIKDGYYCLDTSGEAERVYVEPARLSCR